MKLATGNQTIPEVCKGGVIAIGNFDGVHRGHQEVLAIANAKADALNAPLGALTFEPHPRTFFRPDQAVFRLTPRDLKSHLLAACGVGLVCVLDFDEALASQEAEEFIRYQIVERLGARHVVMGYDFHFGHGRKGSPELMKTIGADNGFSVTVVEQVTDDNGLAPFSSSSIREALRRGDVEDAASQLGYWWYVQGVVEEGDKRGRTIGFPTVNIHVDCGGHPANGIYACRVRDVASGEVWRGAGYVGDRPTFERDGIVLEVHLLGFSGDLYGHELAVEFISFLRPDRKYEHVTDLVDQMRLDCGEIDGPLTAIEANDPMRQFPIGHMIAEGSLRFPRAG
jgi:riboflavin kinase/FMN adenylyltransferase